MKLAVLGRDGVINQVRSGGVVSSDDWEPVRGSLDGIARLTRAGIRVVVATNQHALRDGDLDLDKLHDIHEKMLRLVGETGGAIDSIFFSSTGDPDSHGKRQPKVALLEQIQSRYRVDYEDMVVFGDQREDLDAASQVGAQPVLVQTGHGRKMLGELHRYDGVTIYSDLSAAVEALIKR